MPGIPHRLQRKWRKYTVELRTALSNKGKNMHFYANKFSTSFTLCSTAETINHCLADHQRKIVQRSCLVLASSTAYQIKIVQLQILY